MKKKISVEDALIGGLKDARDFERGRKSLKKHRREMPSPAPHFSSKEIRHLRQDVFEVTQEEFAIILNVAVGTVRSWEQGLRKPADASNRLLQLLENMGPVAALNEMKSA